VRNGARDCAIRTEKMKKNGRRWEVKEVRPCWSQVKWEKSAKWEGEETERREEEKGSGGGNCEVEEVRPCWPRVTWGKRARWKEERRKRTELLKEVEHRSRTRRGKTTRRRTQRRREGWTMGTATAETARDSEPRC
jgi:hypothetical protein